MNVTERFHPRKNPSLVIGLLFTGIAFLLLIVSPPTKEQTLAISVRAALFVICLLLAGWTQGTRGTPAREDFRSDFFFNLIIGAGWCLLPFIVCHLPSDSKAVQLTVLVLIAGMLLQLGAHCRYAYWRWQHPSPRPSGRPS